LRALGQDDLGELLGGFPQDTVSRLERGAAVAVPLDLVTGIAQWCYAERISTAWLFGGDGPAEAAFVGLPDNPLMAQLAHYLRLGSDAQPPLAVAGPEQPRIAKASLVEWERKRDAAAVLSQATKTQTAPPAVAVTLYEAGYQTVLAEGLTGPWQGRYVPIINRLAAGERIDVDTDQAEAHPPGWADEFVEFAGAPPGAVALRVTGDSMSPTYADGDMVIADGGQPVRSGVAAVIYARDGSRCARLKRLTIRGRRAVLASINPAHPPIELDAGQLVGAYKIVAHLPWKRQRAAGQL